MTAAKLDRRIDLQRNTPGQSASGALIENWTNIAQRVAANYAPMSGSERNAASQWVASQQVKFRIRWRADLANLNPKNRIIYPAIMDGLSPEDVISDDRIFDIVECHETDRREWLDIVAVRHADGGST